MKVAAFVFVAAVAAASVPSQSLLRLTSGSGAGERHPVPSLEGTIVAYVAMVNDRREVFTVPIDGGARAQRTTGAAVRVGWSMLDSWPALSIADDGNRIAYWNAQGVHVLDIQASTDIVVAAAASLPYPQISGDGSRVAYQDLVGTDLEVFVVAAAGGTPVQITQASGAGRRLPHLRGDLVVFQKPVSGQQEVFVHDLTSGQTTGPLTSGSGLGNRYARLSPDGERIAYETVVATTKQAMVLELASGTPAALGSAAPGDRLAWPSGDSEAVLQNPVTNLEVFLASPAVQALTSGNRAGLRRPACDRHGTVVVFQSEDAGTVEVFRHRLSYPVQVSTYGAHGQPSVGSLVEFDTRYRRTATIGLRTSLAPGTAAALLVGTQSASLPLAGAPGNSIYVQPIGSSPLAVDAGGALSLTFVAPTVLSAQIAYAQWLLLDPPANALQVVASKGVQIDLP